MQQNQRTIKKAVSISGQGLHTGIETTVTFQPAPAGHGISFTRTDLDKTIPVLATYITNTNRGTRLEYDGAIAQTTEHALAAVVSLGIDNLIIEITQEELPILDGSSYPFIQVLEEAGIKDVLCKSLGSPNHINVARATIDGLANLQRPDQIGSLRGLDPEEFVPTGMLNAYKESERTVRSLNKG